VGKRWEIFIYQQQYPFVEERALERRNSVHTVPDTKGIQGSLSG